MSCRLRQDILLQKSQESQKRKDKKYHHTQKAGGQIQPRAYFLFPQGLACPRLFPA